MPNQARLASTPLIDVGEIGGKAAVLGEKVVPVAAVVAAVAKVGGGPDDLVHIADRRGDLVDQALVLEEHHLGFAVGIVVSCPALCLLVVLQQAAAPHRVIDLVRAAFTP